MLKLLYSNPKIDKALENHPGTDVFDQEIAKERLGRFGFGLCESGRERGLVAGKDDPDQDRGDDKERYQSQEVNMEPSHGLGHNERYCKTCNHCSHDPGRQGQRPDPSPGIEYFIGSDGHSPRTKAPRLSEAVKKVGAIIGDEKAKALVTDNPQAVLDNLDIPSLPEPVNPEDQEKKLKIKIPRIFRKHK